MLRLFVFPCFALLVTVGMAAPVPKDTKKPVLYFPTKVGAKWVYEFEGGSTYADVVTEVEEGKDEALLVSVGHQFDNGEVFITHKYELSPKGLFAVALELNAYDPPICLFKLPFKASEKWENKTKLGGEAVNHGARRVIGIEKVEVPAGKFEAIGVEYWPSVKPEEKAIRHLEWYAPDIGMVKLESTVKEYNRVLKSFKPGKD